jgi:anthranilate synthase component 1
LTVNSNYDIHPAPDEFQRLCREGNLIPVWTELVADAETPVSAFQKIGGSGGRYAFLLESAEKNDLTGRYSFLGASPSLMIESTGRHIRVTESGQLTQYEADDPLEELRKIMSRYRPAGELPEMPFWGGAVGYCGYDIVRAFEPTVPPAPKDELGLPDMLYMVTDTLLVFDHRYRRLKVVAHAYTDGAESPEAAYRKAVQRIEEVMARLAAPIDLPAIRIRRESPEVRLAGNTTREEYMAMVEAAKEYIRAGDIFQVVCAQRFETEFRQPPLALYRHLRHINPSPYMFCLQFPQHHFALVGSSPELHVKVMNRQVEIRPIAGTRPRGASPEQDEALAEDLLADPKERAEHIMLVDLARNDVGRVSEFGTVSVPAEELMFIEKYSHVMHIVSNVTGKLRKDRNAYDVLRATFPAGTVSGSPKVRAMQIINELEKSKRCAYAGTVGYFGFDGNHNSCITLRSVVLKDNKAYVQTGAGLVADSTPEGEYLECVNKAMAMLKAIEQCKLSKGWKS